MCCEVGGVHAGRAILLQQQSGHAALCIQGRHYVHTHALTDTGNNYTCDFGKADGQCAGEDGKQLCPITCGSCGALMCCAD